MLAIYGGARPQTGPGEREVPPGLPEEEEVHPGQKVHAQKVLVQKVPIILNIGSPLLLRHLKESSLPGR